LSRLQEILLRAAGDDRALRVVGAHDGLTAILAERAGFDAIWAGGLGISLAHGVPDAGILTMTERLADAVRMKRACELPIIADVDSGFGDVNIVRRMATLYAEAGIDGVCIEDKRGPKRNSFWPSNCLEDPHVFAHRVSVIKETPKTSLFVIARIEALIAGESMGDALDRAALYVEAGADALAIHSKHETVAEIDKFCSGLQETDCDSPIFVIPTTYPSADVHQLHRLGASGVIYANQGMRAIVSAVEHTFEEIMLHGSSLPLESSIASVDRLFDLSGAHSLLPVTATGQ
jgi:phosphoenolpyruvate phosphomutase